MGEGRRLVAGELILGEARAAACGEAEAVESLVKEHARFVYRVAYTVLRDHHDAEDAVQETFLRVLRFRQRMQMPMKRWRAHELARRWKS